MHFLSFNHKLEIKLTVDLVVNLNIPIYYLLFFDIHVNLDKLDILLPKILRQNFTSSISTHLFKANLFSTNFKQNLAILIL